MKQKYWQFNKMKMEAMEFKLRVQIFVGFIDNRDRN